MVRIWNYYWINESYYRNCKKREFKFQGNLKDKVFFIDEHLTSQSYDIIVFFVEL